MTETTSIVPQKLLLATDLSGRCDRALDRAAMLAMEWSARLTIVHALEKRPDPGAPPRRYEPSWRREPDRRYAVAKRQIHQDMNDRDVPFELVIEEGEPAEVVLTVSQELGSDLLITGTARDEFLGRMLLGDTVDKLVRSTVAPVLVVKSRARRSYEHIVVAVDFSKASRAALLKTLVLFPNAHVSLLHCYADLASGFVDPNTAQHVGRDMAEGECDDFLKTTGLSDRGLSNMPRLLERGNLDAIVHAYAMDNPLDLLVIGSQGRNAVARLILGSTAELLLSTSPSDVLVVNGAKRH